MKELFFTLPHDEKFSIERFSNQELHVTLKTDVADHHCFILGTISPPDENLFSLLALCHTLKKEKAKKITVLIPYLAYMRHDKDEPKKSRLTHLVGQLFKASGIDEVRCVDLHSETDKELFAIPLFSYSPAPLFAKEIKNLGLLEASLVSPDKGAINRCQDVLKALGRTDGIAWMSKKRTDKGVLHFELHGDVKEKAIIIDDILDTGQTLISCCKKLIEKGTKEITIMVTHGLFTGNEWQKLWNFPVKAIICTNTVKTPKDPRIHSLSAETLWKS